MISYLERERRRRIVFWLAVLLLAAGGFYLGLWLRGPEPPNRITIATGNPDGAYAAFGKQYAEILAAKGLDVELISTAGSVENLQRLDAGEADVAFVQAGTYRPQDDPQRELRGIASVYLEPLWIFYRGGAVQRLYQFRGKRIAIGPQGSGTDAVSRVLLEANGVTPENSELVNQSFEQAAQALKNEELDVAIFVSSYRSALIEALSKNSGVRLLDFERDDAYTRKFPYLKRVPLAEGVLDLERNIPARDMVVVAPSVLLACRRELHPRVIELVLAAAREVHSSGSLIDPPGRFPSPEGLDVPLHETAEAYLRSGQSFISRVLPYWAVRLVFKAQVLILPLLALWLPFMKLAPAIYSWRVNRLLKHHYAALRELETHIEDAASVERVREALEMLVHLREEMERLSSKLPAHLQRDVYHWRMHIRLVHEEGEQRLRDLLHIGQHGGRRFPPRRGFSRAMIRGTNGNAANGKAKRRASRRSRA